MGKLVKRPKRKDSHAAAERGFNAALLRRTKDSPRDRQRAFGRCGRRPQACWTVGEGANSDLALWRRVALAPNGQPVPYDNE